MLVLLLLPLLTLVGRVLAETEGLESLARGPLFSAVALSLTTTTISVVVIATFGTPLAFAFARYDFPFKRILNVLIELPIVLPPVVAGLALLMAFGRRGLVGAWLAKMGIILPFSPVAVVIAQVFVAAPFFIRAAQVQFRGIPVEVEEAASIDGANGLQAFRHVILPLSSRGLLAGLVLSWARALGEFGATIMFAGNLRGTTQTMPLFVYSALEQNFDAALWAGVMLIWVALLALGLMRWLSSAVDPIEGHPINT